MMYTKRIEVKFKDFVDDCPSGDFLSKGPGLNFTGQWFINLCHPGVVG